MNRALTHSGATAEGHRSFRHRHAMCAFFFDELKNYMGFDEDVEQLLIECVPILRPKYDSIVDEFYEALNANRRTRDVFESPAQIERLKATLKVWLHEAFSGPWDDLYFQKRLRIGQVHVRVGLLPHFMGGAMNIIRRHVVLALVDSDTVGTDHLEAAEILLDLELTMMMQTYWDHMMELKLEMPLALATGLAHEIRNPLNAIALNLTLLERKLARLGERQAGEIVDASRDEVRRITALTTELMDFAKPLAVTPGWTRADGLLQELEQLHGAQFAESGIALLTKSKGDPEIWVDADRFRQALHNLLANAAEAIDGDSGQIRVELVNDKSSTTIAVTDSGPGVSPDMAYKIFDLFFTQKASGTGLGLPIVKKIVEAHGGIIEVDSPPGGGATFRIRLPRPDRSGDERR